MTEKISTNFQKIKSRWTSCKWPSQAMRVPTWQKIGWFLTQMLRRTEELETTSNSKGEVEAVNKFCANSFGEQGDSQIPLLCPKQPGKSLSSAHQKLGFSLKKKKKKKVQQKGRKPALSRKPEGSAILTVRVK